MAILPLTTTSSSAVQLHQESERRPDHDPLRALVIDEVPGPLIQLLDESEDYRVLDICASSADARQVVERDLPDVVFLDARCATDDLVEFFTRSRTTVEPTLVLVADHPGLALKAFELGASDYLLRPIRGDRFERTTARVRKLRAGVKAVAAPGNELARVPCVIGHGIKLIDPEEIELVRSGPCGIHLVTARGEFLTELTLTTLEARISDFLRCHKQYLVHVGHIDELVRSNTSTATIRTHSGKLVPVSRRFLAPVKRRLLIH